MYVCLHACMYLMCAYIYVLYTNMYVCVYLYMPACASRYLSICLSVCLPACLTLSFMTDCLSVSLSLCLSLSLYGAWGSRQRPGRFPGARAHTRSSRGVRLFPPRSFLLRGSAVKKETRGVSAPLCRLLDQHPKLIVGSELPSRVGAAALPLSLSLSVLCSRALLRAVLSEPADA